MAEKDKTKNKDEQEEQTKLKNLKINFFTNYKNLVVLLNMAFVKKVQHTKYK